MKRSLNQLLPPTNPTKIAYTSTKLSTQFHTNDKPTTSHQHDIVYLATCPDPSCNASYIGETARRLEERIKDHSGRDSNSHILKHSISTSHPPSTLKNFKVIGRNFRNSWKRKLAEALMLKEYSPKLNTQKKSVPIKLLN